MELDRQDVLARYGRTELNRIWTVLVCAESMRRSGWTKWRWGRIQQQRTQCVFVV